MEARPPARHGGGTTPRPPPFPFGTGLLAAQRDAACLLGHAPLPTLPEANRETWNNKLSHTLPVPLGWQPITAPNGPGASPDVPFASIARWRSRRGANGIVDPQPPPYDVVIPRVPGTGMKGDPPCPRMGSRYKTCLWSAQESKPNINNHQLLVHIHTTTRPPLPPPPPPLPPQPPQPPPSCASPPSSPPLPPWLPCVPSPTTPPKTPH